MFPVPARVKGGRKDVRCIIELTFFIIMENMAKYISVLSKTLCLLVITRRIVFTWLLFICSLVCWMDTMRLISRLYLILRIRTIYVLRYKAYE